MAFKPVNDLDCETTVALGGHNKKTGKANPTRMEGYYIGAKDTVNKKAKSGFSKLHIFATEKGNVGVWGKTDLDRKLANVTPGFMTRVTLNGTVPTPNGDMYKYKVEIDEENTMEVAAPNSAQADDGVEDESFADVTDESFDAEEEVPLDEVPPARPVKAVKALAPSAERQAKVQALLNRGK